MRLALLILTPSASLASQLGRALIYVLVIALILFAIKALADRIGRGRS